MTTKEMIITTANEQHGGFVNTDGEWSAANDPTKFRRMLEKLGFTVIECKETYNSTAVAITEDGYRIAYNGYCTRV